MKDSSLEWHGEIPAHWEVRCVVSSRLGNCYDNAVVESFFNLLKRERIRQRIYR